MKIKVPFVMFSIQDLKNIDLEKLFHFYLVYRSGSIKRTSEDNDIPTTALRHSIQTIEKKLGQKLYQPVQKNFIPTEAANTLYNTCRQIIEGIGSLELKQNQYAKQLNTQEIIVCTGSTFANYFLPPIITSFNQKHPLVSVKVITASSQARMQELPFDVLISSKINSPVYAVHQLAAFNYYLYATPALSVKFKNIKNIEDIRGENILLYEGDHLLDEQFVKNNNVILRSDSYPFLMHMCAQGLGILSCFDMKVLGDLHMKIDIQKIIPHLITEQDHGYFYYHKLSNKSDLVLDLYAETKEFLNHLGEKS